MLIRMVKVHDADIRIIDALAYDHSDILTAQGLPRHSQVGHPDLSNTGPYSHSLWQVNRGHRHFLKQVA